MSPGSHVYPQFPTTGAAFGCPEDRREAGAALWALRGLQPQANGCCFFAAKTIEEEKTIKWTKIISFNTKMVIHDLDDSGVPPF